MRRHRNAAAWWRSSTREEEISEHVRGMLALVDLGVITLEQVRFYLVMRFIKYRVHVSVIDAAIKSERGQR